MHARMTSRGPAVQSHSYCASGKAHCATLALLKGRHRPSGHHVATRAVGQENQFTASQAAAGVLAALSIWSAQPCWAEGVVTQPAAAGAAAVPTVYFGNGCFWGRQKDYVDVEKQMGRAPQELSAVVGYAGGAQVGPDGKVCYYYSDPRTVYERLGHAEVVSVALSPDEQAQRSEFRRFADTYFRQFRRVPGSGGMQRLDPQDAGPGYRNVIGIPGGVTSPLFAELQAANVNGMELREGAGNSFKGGAPTESDLLNVVWVVDSGPLPFHRAEQYHQFHNGIGKAFPKQYTRDLKEQMAAAGKIGSTGCPEFPF